jgi:hypothetical protein
MGGMLLAGFAGVMMCVGHMPMRAMGVVGRFFVIAGFVVLGCFAMVPRRMLMMFGRVVVMLCYRMFMFHFVSPLVSRSDLGASLQCFL